MVHASDGLTVVFFKLVDCGLGGGERYEVAAGGACVHDSAFRYGLHDLSLTGNNGEGEATGCGLGQGSQVGSYAKKLLSTTDGESEAGDDLVEDENYAIFVAELADALQVTGPGECTVGVDGYRFHDDGCDLSGVFADSIGENVEVVPGEDNDFFCGPGRLALGLGDGEGGVMGAGVLGVRGDAIEDGVCPAVVMTLELDDKGAVGVGTSDPDGGEDGLGA